jgi:FKBP-type peptidyl-prolyl cis-trans isomerase 2
MSEAKHGDTVKVHYTGKLKNGQVFDSSLNRRPLQFTIGGGGIIPGFQHAVVGMRPGQSKTIHVPMSKAYGPHREDMVVAVDQEQLPDNLEPEVGQTLEITGPDGLRAVASVAHVSEGSVTLDINHPLAGKELIFDIQLLEIV